VFFLGEIMAKGKEKQSGKKDKKDKNKKASVSAGQGTAAKAAVATYADGSALDRCNTWRPSSF
jgi:hypothetical protein